MTGNEIGSNVEVSQSGDSNPVSDSIITVLNDDLMCKRHKSHVTFLKNVVALT